MDDTPEDQSPTLCQSCGLQPAAVEFIQVTGSERRQVALCRDCAASHGVEMQLDAFQRLAQLLIHQMRPLNNQMSEEWQEAMNRTCSQCGMSFEQFAKTGLLGCPQCYSDFHDLLMPVLRRLHGVTRQTADETTSANAELQPLASTISEESRLQLEAELQLALMEEDFEKAATIRDRLKEH